MEMPKFTHVWSSRYGWGTTAFKFHDFTHVEVLGENDYGIIYLAISANGQRYILRDNTKSKK